jgi:hypothetical protein
MFAVAPDKAVVVPVVSSNLAPASAVAEGMAAGSPTLAFPVTAETGGALEDFIDWREEEALEGMPPEEATLVEFWPPTGLFPPAGTPASAAGHLSTLLASSLYGPTCSSALETW